MRRDRENPDVVHHDVTKLLRATGAPAAGWWAVYRDTKTKQLRWQEVACWGEVQCGSHSFNRETGQRTPVEWIDSVDDPDEPLVFVTGLVREYGSALLVPVEELFAQFEFATYVFDPDRKPDVASWVGLDEADAATASSEVAA